MKLVVLSLLFIFLLTGGEATIASAHTADGNSLPVASRPNRTRQIARARRLRARRLQVRRLRRSRALARRRNTTTTTPAAFTVRQVDDNQLVELIRARAADSRPVLVNLWATWCAPCREEFPDLVRIDDKYRPRGLDFYTVSVDDISLAATVVPEFLREMKADRIPAYQLNIDAPETIIDRLDATWKDAIGLPVTFLFDRTGAIVFRHSGRIKPAELEAAIEKVTSDE